MTGVLAAALGRSAAIPGRRLLACAALAVLAVLLFSSVGVLLAIAALLLALDAIVPQTAVSPAEADDRFRRLLRRRRREALTARLRRRPADGLRVLDDRTGWASVAPRRALGVELLAVASVTGTVEAAKATRFDASLRPDRPAAERWKGLWMAQARGVALPPIDVYRVGQDHVLRDGHHRVSVARDQGLAAIEAEVVELHPPGR